MLYSLKLSPSPKYPLACPPHSEVPCFFYFEYLVTQHILRIFAEQNKMIYIMQLNALAILRPGKTNRIGGHATEDLQNLLGEVTHLEEPLMIP